MGDGGETDVIDMKGDHKDMDKEPQFLLHKAARDNETDLIVQIGIDRSVGDPGVIVFQIEAKGGPAVQIGLQVSDARCIGIALGTTANLLESMTRDGTTGGPVGMRKGAKEVM